MGSNHGWLGHVTALLFVLRALIAPGYMPDFGETHAGVLKLVICSAKGTFVVSVDRDGRPLPAPAAGHHAESDCAFAGLSPPTGPPPQGAELAVVFVPPIGRLTFAMTEPRAPLWRAGPMVGSRAPPLAA
jgi:hypothetical protein